MTNDFVTDISKYIKIIDDFIAGATSAPAFEQRYLSTFRQQEDFFEQEIFEILNRLFTDVDCYVEDPELPTEPEDLDDEQLRQKAREARAALTPHLTS